MKGNDQDPGQGELLKKLDPAAEARSYAAAVEGKRQETGKGAKNVVSFKEALKTAIRELEPGEKLIDAFETDDYYGFAIGPADWFGEAGISACHFFIDKNTGAISRDDPLGMLIEMIDKKECRRTREMRRLCRQALKKPKSC